MARESLTAFSLGIAPFMLVKVLAAGFYARQNMRTPVRIGVLAMIANMVFNGLLIWPLAHAGIALATSLAAILNTGCLFYFLCKEKIYVPRDGWWFFSTRLIFDNTILAMWLWVGAGPLSEWLTHSISWRFVHLLGLLLLAMAIYGISLWLAGIRVHHLLIPNQRLVT